MAPLHPTLSSLATLPRPARISIALGTGIASGLLVHTLLGVVFPNASSLPAAAPKTWQGPFEKKMSHYEARMILGLSENYSKGDVQKRYHELMQKNHPDKGGSNFLACKVSEARNILERK